MTDIMEYHRTFLHPIVDGSIHLGRNLTSRSADLLISVKIDFVDDRAFATHILQQTGQCFGISNETAFVVGKERNHVTPRLHSGGIFDNVTFNLIHHL